MQHLAVLTDEPLSTRDPVVYCRRGPFGPVTITRDQVSLPFLALPLPPTADSNRYPLPEGVVGLALLSTAAASSLGISQQTVVSIAPFAVRASTSLLQLIK